MDSFESEPNVNGLLSLQMNGESIPNVIHSKLYTTMVDLHIYDMT